MTYFDPVRGHVVESKLLPRAIVFGVVAALALQSAGFLIWAGATGERLADLERQQELIACLAPGAGE